MSIQLDKSPPLTLFWGHGNERATSAQGRGAEPAADPGRGEGALYRARPGGVAERHRPPRRRRRGHRLSAFPRPGAADRGALRAAARADPRAGRGSPRRARSLAGVHTLPRARPRAAGGRPRPAGTPARSPGRTRAVNEAQRPATPAPRRTRGARPRSRRAPCRLRPRAPAGHPPDAERRHRRRPRHRARALAPLPRDPAPRPQGHARTARATPGSTGLSDPDGRALGRRLDAPARLRSREWLLDRLARIASVAPCAEHGA